ncbi:phage antirepressor KilAC domain-containing protein [Burkholderia gladioli]|uniref:phage antirepressor KilAC domain-containing protein n=1 Tax=Burkholderia gladioli TaxID=28095 RepID=UPI00164059E4|nr:phage regulatory protein/antirepressor Ant [Burkholderia gladioli]
MGSLITSTELTMSSREIAELTSKEHRNVLADIRKMLSELGKAAAEFSAVAKIAGPNGSVRDIEVFELPKRETLILVSGYSIVMRARIIDRWQELESRPAQPAINLDDPAFLRGALLQYTERVIQLENTVAEQAPAVEFARAIRNTEDAISIGKMAAVLGIGRNTFFMKLRADHILMADNLPYQHYKDRGYFRVIEGAWFDAEHQPHTTFKTLVTGRGQVYLQRRYGKQSERAA